MSDKMIDSVLQEEKDELARPSYAPQPVIGPCPKFCSNTTPSWVTVCGIDIVQHGYKFDWYLRVTVMRNDYTNPQTFENDYPFLHNLKEFLIYRHYMSQEAVEDLDFADSEVQGDEEIYLNYSELFYEEWEEQKKKDLYEIRA
jgi:hypothetical protein